jgi:DNA-binding NtrC family response regulator
MQSVLVASGNKGIVATFQSALAGEYRIDSVATMEQALKKYDARRYDLFFVDLVLITVKKGGGFEEAFAPFKSQYPTIEIVVICPKGQVKRAVEALKAGAREYVLDSVLPEEVKMAVENIRSAIIQRSELDYLRDQSWRLDAKEVVFTHNEQMKNVFKKIQSVAPTKATILINGETGTGKGVMAKLIHQHSPRQRSQFISVHCGAIPETLLESELFGHEKGAFTGAIRRKLGKFEIARGGTIFLDEIGTITPSAQIKLLQVLQDGTYSRVGGEEILKTDARVIAATNADLNKMISDGLLRKDLFYRLNVFPIDIPPLRDRIQDLPLFLDFYLKKLNRLYRKRITKIRPIVVETLQRYSWPGNIRELENLVERAYILEETDQLSPESFPIDLFQDEGPATILPLDTCLPLAEARKRAIDAFERQYLKDLLLRNHGRIKKSADEAGVTTRQIHKLLTRHGLRKEDFKLPSQQ